VTGEAGSKDGLRAIAAQNGRCHVDVRSITAIGEFGRQGSRSTSSDGAQQQAEADYQNIFGAGHFFPHRGCRTVPWFLTVGRGAVPGPCFG
jgi:hypothetical protein